uniref:Putative secreted protein n=1 Tax=Ixodes ricinus TaxID=34613 RepID=V5GFX3_IXORI
MAVRVSTLFCIVAAAIIQIPETQSKPISQTRYDAWEELKDRFGQKYYLVQRSYEVDTKLGGRASCVSVLKLNQVFGEHSINAQITIKQNRHGDVPTNKNVRMTAYTPAGERTEYMIKTTDRETMTVLFIQELVFADRQTCRVLVHTTQGVKHCQLWAHHRAASSGLRGCKDEYSKYCSAIHSIFKPECLNM